MTLGVLAGRILASEKRIWSCRKVSERNEKRAASATTAVAAAGVTRAGTSRRRFLGALGLGVAGAALVGGMLSMARRDKGAEAASEFPGPDSIFHPAQDPRQDPRR